MINQQILERLREIALECLKRNNLELVQINYSGRQRPVITLLIDRPEGGISIDECALMNKVIGEEWDAADILAGGYILEVSSPGIDWPLVNKSDFLRARNKKVRCFLKEAVSAKREMEGRVLEVNDACIILEADCGPLEIPLHNINKAKQVID